MRISDWSSYVCSSDLLDLLSGAWRPKRRWALDPALLRLGKRLLAALVLVSLAIPLVHALRLASDTRRADEAVVATAKKAGVTAPDAAAARTEERRGGKGCVSTGWSRWSPYH